MRNIEKICQWLGIVKPEQMRNGSRHEDLKGDTVALAKLVMKEGEKRLFAKSEARAKSCHTKPKCAFAYCVHFVDHTPSAGSA